MNFTPTALPGCVEIRATPLGDDRGYFMRTFCREEFLAAGLSPTLAQTSISFNKDRATLRALHFQAHPCMEDRLVRCVSGAIFDVAVDLRPGSPTFGKWHAAELRADNHLQLYIPKGFAHGFQTLQPDSLVSYQMSEPFQTELASGLKWDDPDIGINWPLTPTNQSERDLTLPLLHDLDQSKLQPYDIQGPGS
jgi:dTDP-4-dehydrorhamnose 3,5-epimerase